MEVITQYADRKTELGERIRVLEEERSSLMSDIVSLKEKLTVLDLERHSASLNNEVEALRTEKTVLEEKIASFSVDNPSSSPTEGYQV